MSILENFPLVHLEEAFIVLTMVLEDVIQKKWAWHDQETPRQTVVYIITDSSSPQERNYL